MHGKRRVRRDDLTRIGMTCLAALVALMTGCASSPAGRGRGGDGVSAQPRAEQVLLARAGSQVTIEWKTRVGYVYALVTKDRPDPRQSWRPVEGHERITGTGRRQTVRLPSWPGDMRRFTVISVPAQQADRLPGGRRAER